MSDKVVFEMVGVFYDSLKNRQKRLNENQEAFEKETDPEEKAYLKQEIERLKRDIETCKQALGGLYSNIIKEKKCI